MVTTGGKGDVRVDGKVVPAVPGRAVLLKPGEPHDYGTAGKSWSFFWVHFVPRPGWEPWAPGLSRAALVDLPKSKVPNTGEAPAQRVARAFRHLLAEQDRPGNLTTPLVDSALSEILLVILRQSGWERGGDPDPRLEQVLALLSGDLGGKLTLGEMSSRAGLSVSGFSHWFQARMGLSPIQYRLRLRLRRAASILEHRDTALTEIADELGFHNLFHFSNQFKAWYGRSPRNWRAKVQGEGSESGEG